RRCFVYYRSMTFPKNVFSASLSIAKFFAFLAIKICQTSFERERFLRVGAEACVSEWGQGHTWSLNREFGRSLGPPKHDRLQASTGLASRFLALGNQEMSEAGQAFHPAEA